MRVALALLLATAPLVQAFPGPFASSDQQVSVYFAAKHYRTGEATDVVFVLVQAEHRVRYARVELSSGGLFLGHEDDRGKGDVLFTHVVIAADRRMQLTVTSPGTPNLPRVDATVEVAFDSQTVPAPADPGFDTRSQFTKVLDSGWPAKIGGGILALFSLSLVLGSLGRGSSAKPAPTKAGGSAPARPRGRGFVSRLVMFAIGLALGALALRLWGIALPGVT